jgi:cytochrome c oxidase subunit 3
MDRTLTQIHAHPAAGSHRDRLQAHFATLETQTHAAFLGTWVFLASEVLFFGALFALYTGYRSAYPEAFTASARHTDLMLGSLMTYLLLTASFFVAIAVGLIRANRRRGAARALALAAVLGVIFLGLKLLEWFEHFGEGIFPGLHMGAPALAGRGERAFFTLYYLMTGLHFLHVTGGVVVLAVLAWLTRRGAYGAAYHTPIEVGGLYWHFVDIVWLFLWPMFYLWR